MCVPRRTGLCALRLAVAVPAVRWAVFEACAAGREGRWELWTDLVMEACAGVRKVSMRAAPADVATNPVSKKAINAVRTIRGARRNQSIFSVRRSRAKLEC